MEVSKFEVKSMFGLVNISIQNLFSAYISYVMCQLWALIRINFTKPNMLLASNLEISLLTTTSTCAE